MLGAIAIMMMALPTILFSVGGADATGDRGAWFRSLRVPGMKASCCDVADCQSTDANWRGGQWWAVVGGRWRPVPNEKVLKSPRSIDGSAYVCSGAPSWNVGGTEPPIYCFVPPNWPM